MCAYNKVSGDWSCETRHLLTDVLTRDCSVPGWVMSNWGTIHSTAKAANAGLDQKSGQELDDRIYFADALNADLAAGRVPMARLDDVVVRYPTGLIATVAYDAPMRAVPATIPCAEHALVAQRAAEAGIVLKNDRDMLPLAARARRIV